MKTTKLLLCAVGLVIAFASAKAQAQTLVATLDEISPGESVSGTTNGTDFGSFPAGVLDFDLFDAFCIEPYQPLSYGETVVYQVQDPSTLAHAVTVARLVGGFLASDMSSTHAAALQWAIWEVIAETTTPLSLFDGTIRLQDTSSGSVADLANWYLDHVDTFAEADVIFLTNEHRQDVVAWNVIPEPSTAGLAGLSAMLLMRRRR